MLRNRRSAAGCLSVLRVIGSRTAEHGARGAARLKDERAGFDDGHALTREMLLVGLLERPDSCRVRGSGPPAMVSSEDGTTGAG